MITFPAHVAHPLFFHNGKAHLGSVQPNQPNRDRPKQNTRSRAGVVLIPRR